jgi:hypothetical protein
MRENRQSGSEGREARKRAFLTPIGSSHPMNSQPAGSPETILNIAAPAKQGYASKHLI